MAKISATGYVHQMLDSKQTFEEFAMTCARAFGALIMLHDEGFDAEIPERFEPDTKYYDAKLREADSCLQRLAQMNEAERLHYGQRVKDEAIERYRRFVHDEEYEYGKCRAMMKRVEAWQPPTEGHANLKKFMLDQLTQSAPEDGTKYFCDLLETALQQAPILFYKRDVEGARHDIEYYTVQRQKEIERVEERNQWLKQLRDSLQPQ